MRAFSYTKSRTEAEIAEYIMEWINIESNDMTLGNCPDAIAVVQKGKHKEAYTKIKYCSQFHLRCSIKTKYSNNQMDNWVTIMEVELISMHLLELT
jgi:alpha-D-ribose 1-methylphosphonate 5-triphosphate diphosphatase PhnM